jgi:hypothetical protein
LIPPSATQVDTLSSNERKNKGILVYALNELFDNVKSSPKAFIIKCSYFEIYNDQVFDLLQEREEQMQDPLQLAEDIKKKEFVVRGLRESIVENFTDCMALLKLGEHNRHYAMTKMNH